MKGFFWSQLTILKLVVANSAHACTVEPRFNEVPRDWGNLFVISRVRYIENLDITNLWENIQNVGYIEVYRRVPKVAAPRK